MTEELFLSNTKRPQDQLVDLASCADEPIHIPGAIQPIGALIVVRISDFKIIQVSENFCTILDYQLVEILDRTLEEIVGTEIDLKLRRYVESTSLRRLTPLPFSLRTKSGEIIEFECLAHKYAEGYVILEFCEVEEAHGEEHSYNLAEVLRLGLESLHAADTIETASDLAAQEIRKISGYDRVMVYRFSKDWHGEVIAESKGDIEDSFLGLHYPATDIPEQARRLYTRNLTRLIADVDYNSVRLVPVTNSVTGQPLDMSDCLLRSTSPIHVEYLKNMGVRGTLTISILIEGALWGLIACHHYSTYNCSFWVRSACQLLGQSLSLKLIGIQNTAAVSQRAQVAEVCDRFLESSRRDGFPNAIRRAAPALCELFEGCGLIYASNADYFSHGNVPPPKSIATCLKYLKAHEAKIFSSDFIAESIPKSNFSTDIAGLIAIPVHLEDDAWLFIMRPELRRTVTWAGNPNDHVVVDEHYRLHPRLSFERWSEEVRGKSNQWTAAEIKLAETLQQKLLTAREQSSEFQNQKSQLLDSQSADFVSAIAHDLRNPLIGSLRTIELLRSGKMTDDSNALKEILNEISGSHKQLLSRIKDLLLRYGNPDTPISLSQSVVDIASIVKTVAEQVSNRLRSGQVLNIAQLDDSFLVFGDEDLLSRVFEEILAHSIERTADDGPITIDLVRVKESIEISFTDSGPVMPEEDLLTMFERSWRPAEASYCSTHGISLFICKRIIEAHAGQIEYLISDSKKNVCRVRLPLRPAVTS